MWVYKQFVLVCIFVQYSISRFCHTLLVSMAASAGWSTPLRAGFLKPQSFSPLSVNQAFGFSGTPEVPQTSTAVDENVTNTPLKAVDVKNVPVSGSPQKKTTPRRSARRSSRLYRKVSRDFCQIGFGIGGEQSNVQARLSAGTRTPNSPQTPNRAGQHDYLCYIFVALTFLSL